MPRAEDLKALREYDITEDDLKPLNDAMDNWDWRHVSAIKVMLNDADYQDGKAGAIRAVSGLSHAQAHALGELYPLGVDPEDLNAFPVAFERYHARALKALLTDPRNEDLSMKKILAEVAQLKDRRHAMKLFHPVSASVPEQPQRQMTAPKH